MIDETMLENQRSQRHGETSGSSALSFHVVAKVWSSFLEALAIGRAKTLACSRATLEEGLRRMAEVLAD